MAPPTLARRLQSLPPMLHKLPLGSMSNCSKAPRGLFVLMRTDGIFTANALSPSPFLRQYPYHYSIRAGQNFNLVNYCFRNRSDYTFISLRDSLGDFAWYIFAYQIRSLNMLTLLFPPNILCLDAWIEILFYIFFKFGKVV